MIRLGKVKCCIRQRHSNRSRTRGEGLEHRSILLPTLQVASSEILTPQLSHLVILDLDTFLTRA